VPFVSGSDQSPLLVAAIKTLRDEGFDLSEIVVLSPVRESATAEISNDPWLRQILHSADGRRAAKGQVLYSTIHAYKGLEAPAVIVTDLEDRATPGFESLLYVGLTRATDRLVAIIESGTIRRALGGTT
jgi:superfamily I DNA/RNA helicase